MKLPLILAAATLLSACAAPPADKPWITLYDEHYLRNEQKWPMTLPQVQRALFAHEAACGSAPQFAVDTLQPNIAYVWQESPDSPGLSRTVLLEITRLQSESLKVKTYARLGVHDADMQRVRNAVLKPEECN